MSVCRLHIIVSRYLNRNGNNGGNRYSQYNPFPDLFYAILSLNFATHHYTSTYTDFVTVRGDKRGHIILMKIDIMEPSKGPFVARW